MKELLNRNRWFTLRAFLQDVTEKLSGKEPPAFGANEHQDKNAFEDVPVDRSTLNTRIESDHENSHDTGGEVEDAVPQRGMDSETIPTITKREQEILELIWAGFKSKDIGHRLGISVRTVEVHRANMMKKMHVSTTAQLLNKGIKTRLI